MNDTERLTIIFTFFKLFLQVQTLLVHLSETVVPSELYDQIRLQFAQCSIN